jgi:succinate dehydrogenase/fumarate reductase flavoprotein subunit
VSGTYMQVMPRFISTAKNGHSDEREFLRLYFDSDGEMNSLIFMKGYQWPFDAAKAIGGSSLIDILVYAETVEKGRRVYLDFRQNSAKFSFDELGSEARTYLAKSGALLNTPLERLNKMNPMAIELYREHGIDIRTEPLEVAVCAQHNNGGLAANHWWESTNIKHLFPVGEVNGSHGVYRPGGSALNAGQVGGFRLAEYIAHRASDWTVDRDAVRQAAARATNEITAWKARAQSAKRHWRAERAILQARMTRYGAHVRTLKETQSAARQAWMQWREISASGLAFEGADELEKALCTRQLCLAHAVYLASIAFALQSGVGSRGSSIILDPTGSQVHSALGEAWRIAPEDMTYRNQVLETALSADDQVRSQWVDKRPIPSSDTWFETAWERYRKGDIY